MCIRDRPSCPLSLLALATALAALPELPFSSCIPTQKEATPAWAARRSRHAGGSAGGSHAARPPDSAGLCLHGP
eukprot:11766995-Alexandrium_andersonii.AAC.1